MFECVWGGYVALLGWAGGDRGRGGKEREGWKREGELLGEGDWMYLPSQAFLLNHIQHDWPVASVCTTSESFEISSC